MKNSNKWRPTKFSVTQNAFKPGNVSAGSYITVQCVSDFVNRNKRRLTEGVQNVLDFGCGNMPYRVLFSDLKSDHYIGVDWEASPHNISYADVVTNLFDFNTSVQFDRILINDVFEHTGEIKQLLRKLKNNLTKDGLIYMNIPFMYWIHEAPYDKVRYSHFYLEEIFDCLGYKVETKVFYGGWFLVVSDIFNKVFTSRLSNRLLFVPKLQLLIDSLIPLKWKQIQTYPLQYCYIISKL